MLNNDLCVIITGIENLTGEHALQMDEFYSLSRYPSSKLSYYLNFDAKIQDRGDNIKPTGNFAEFLIFLGIRGYIYRFDNYCGADSAVDYKLHIEQKLSNSISMPVVKPY